MVARSTFSTGQVMNRLRLLVDHREDLVNERTRIISRLRWHLHELDPGWIPPAKIDRTSAFDKITVHVDSLDEAWWDCP